MDSTKSNAVDALAASPVPKWISVRLRCPKETEAYMLSDTEAFCAIDVVYSGPGVPSDIQNQIISRRIKSNKPSGHGLGLWFCKEVVEQSQGLIYYDPSADNTTFTLFFPYREHKT